LKAGNVNVNLALLNLSDTPLDKLGSGNTSNLLTVRNVPPWIKLTQLLANRYSFIFYSLGAFVFNMRI